VRRDLIICLLLAASTLAVYGQVIDFGFVNIDDIGYVTENLQVHQGLSVDGVVWAFTTRGLANWHPLTWLSLMLDVETYGLDAGGFHATNVLLHLLNTLLLFGALRYMTGESWRSATVAGLFALHPLHVESVAWVSQRKDVLSTLLGLGSLAAYAAYARRPHPGRYLLTAVLLALGLMAKPTLVTLPLVFMLLDHWPLRRGVRIREKIPLLALSAASSAITFWVQKSGGAMSPTDVVPLPLRLSNAVVSYVRYLGKTLWPFDLSVIYPRYLAVGWLWFLGTLVPMIGLVQVGDQAMADRYTYVPSIGLFIALVWGGADWVASQRPRAAWLRPAAVGFAVLTLSACGGIAWRQVGYWRDSVSLFTQSLASAPGSPLAHYNLGVALERAGKGGEALRFYRQAIQIKPEYVEAHNNLANALRARGELATAEHHYRQALRYRPDFPVAHNNLAAVLQSQARTADAIEHYREAVRLDPGYAEAHYNLGVALASTGQLGAAIRSYRQALRVQPGLAEAHNNLGLALRSRGEYDSALEHFRAAAALQPELAQAQYNLGVTLVLRGRFAQALEPLRRVVRLRPDRADTYYYLGLALSETGQPDEAIAQLEIAAARMPSSPSPLRALAWLLATHPEAGRREPERAIRLASRAAELTEHRDPSALDALGAAYASAGDFERAAEAAEAAAQLAEAAGDRQLATRIRERLALYRQSRSLTGSRRLRRAPEPPTSDPSTGRD
jgi:tetratricopeptide (TPR) repeat protein